MEEFQKRRGAVHMAYKAINGLVFVTLCVLVLTAKSEAMTGNQWRELPLTAQQYYIIGLVDAWGQVSDVLTPKQNPPTLCEFCIAAVEKVTKCNRERTYGQLVAIVGKYMNENPSQWHRDMAFLVWVAVYEGCK